MQIAHHTFLITGGASGLGAACSRHLHAAGANIMIADLNMQAGEALVQELGSRAAFHQTDVTQAAAAQAAIEQTCTQFQHLHGLINCAGIAPGERILGKAGPHRLESFAQAIQINLIGTFNMLRLASALMINNTPNSIGERGVIINTASIAGYEGQIGQAAYAASKGGVISMTLPIARELAAYGIRVMAIAPGLFATPMLNNMRAEVQEALNKTTVFPPRLGQAEEYAQLAQQIIENPMLNGSTIRLDGAVRLASR